MFKYFKKAFQFDNYGRAKSAKTFLLTKTYCSALLHFPPLFALPALICKNIYIAQKYAIH